MHGPPVALIPLAILLSTAESSAGDERFGSGLGRSTSDGTHYSLTANRDVSGVTTSAAEPVEASLEIDAVVLVVVELVLARQVPAVGTEARPIRAVLMARPSSSPMSVSATDQSMKKAMADRSQRADEGLTEVDECQPAPVVEDVHLVEVAVEHAGRAVEQRLADLVARASMRPGSPDTAPMAG